MFNVHIQWATQTARGYETTPVADWESAPKKGDPLKEVVPVDDDAGLIAHAVVFGQMMGEDHVSLEMLQDGRLCLCGWSDNAMVDGSPIAKQVFLSEEIVETVRRYSPREGVNVTETMRGPQTTKKIYCAEEFWSPEPIYTNPGEVEFAPMDEFVAPADRTCKHGVLLSNKLWVEHCSFEPPDDVPT